MRLHLDSCPPYVDAPIIRILERILQEEDRHVANGLSLLVERNISWNETLEFESGKFVGKEPISLPVPVWLDGVD
jgi:hypothetical protein